MKIRNRLAIVWLLTGLNLLNYLDRYVVNAVGPRVQDAFHLSDQRLGWVISAFMIGYFVTSPLFGVLGDRLPRKGLIAAGVLVWSVATFASGLAGLAGVAGSFVLLITARIVVGVGEASYATLSPTIIDDLTEPARKNRMLALFYAAIPVGSALGYVVGGQVEHAWGWQYAFYVAGAPGILLALLVLAIDEPRRPIPTTTTAQAGPPPPARPTSLAASTRTLLALPGYRYTVAGYVAYTFALGAFAAWAPKFLEARLELPLKTADFWLGVILAATGFAGTAVGGVIGDRWPGKERTRASLAVCAVSAALAVPFAALTLLARTPTFAFVAIGLTEFFLFVSTAPVNAALLGSVPSHLRASAMALSIFAIHLFGDLISPPAVGHLSDAIRAATSRASGTIDPGSSGDRGASLQAALFILPVAIAVGAALWGWGAWRPADRTRRDAKA